MLANSLVLVSDLHVPHPSAGISAWDSLRREEGQMNILWMIIFGAIVGAIAKLIMPGRDPGGIIVTIIR
jgi:hypothetical protein